MIGLEGDGDDEGQDEVLQLSSYEMIWDAHGTEDSSLEVGAQNAGHHMSLAHIIGSRRTGEARAEKPLDDGEGDV